MQQEEEDEAHAAAKDPTPEEVSAHAEKLIELWKQLDTNVKTNVSAAQERQKKHIMTLDTSKDPTK